ncbi:uncharacterized protein LOC134695054 [Mytilus trossulus]|uniref:uncharacterized protein LOC134695054 n=1 Tax=Mytilus trossulus TaxID=6551 RepID=UPI003004508D
MAAPMSEKLTPRKTYLLGNICVVCGFSFIQKVKEANGIEVEHKYFDRKLKLSEERRKNINNVVGFECKGEGVCQKCYRSVEKVLKTEKESTDLKGKLRQSTQTVENTLLVSVPSPKRVSISKRMLRSPASFQPSKKSDIVPITTMPFNDITNTPNVVRSLPQILPKPTQQKLTEPSKKPARRSLDQSFSPSFTGEVEMLLLICSRRNPK